MFRVLTRFRVVGKAKKKVKKVGKDIPRLNIGKEERFVTKLFSRALTSLFYLGKIDPEKNLSTTSAFMPL